MCMQRSQSLPIRVRLLVCGASWNRHVSACHLLKKHCEGLMAVLSTEAPLQTSHRRHGMSHART